MKIRLVGLHNRQKEIANDILSSNAKFFTINASRQSGKTFLISKLALALGLIENNEEILIVAPSYEQTGNIYNRIVNTKGSDKVISKKKESKPYEVKLMTDTTLKFKSADRPDFIRGSSNKYVIIDEMAFLKEGVFQTVIRPTTAAKKNSKIIVVSTPKGKSNDFYNLSIMASIDPKRYKYYTMKYYDNPYYDDEEIIDARARLPKNIFLQEYEAEFVDSGGDVFEGIDVVSTITEYSRYESDNRYYAAIDWGKANDDTILTIIDKNCKVVKILEVKGEWNIQIDIIAEVLNEYKPIVYAECNGIGDPLITNLRGKYNNVKEFIMSNDSKREIVENLKMKFFTNSISIPTFNLCDKLHSQLIDFTYSISKSGLITYHHKLGSHDDYVDSLAIANYCYDKHNVVFSSVNNRIGRSKFYN